MSDQLIPEEIISSKSVFDGSLFSVSVDELKLSNGCYVSREVIKNRPSVVIVPIDSDDNVVMVRQYRHPVGKYLLEAPAGNIEDLELPLESAQRELQEETGYFSGDLCFIGDFWSSPGFSTELMHAYVARDLVSKPLDPDVDEFIKIEVIPISQIIDYIRTGRIQDAKTISAILMFMFVR